MEYVILLCSLVYYNPSPTYLITEYKSRGTQIQRKVIFDIVHVEVFLLLNVIDSLGMFDYD